MGKHQNFLQDLSTLQSQVNAIQEESAKLQAAYAGEKAMEITNREREVVMLWMDDLMRQMSTSEKPRDVSGVELLMNNHQGHKAEIDAREDNFADVYSLGKELLSMQHYASNGIKEKLRELTDKRNGMIHRWEERWEHLQLILEVYQFARDAAVAEAWLLAQHPYLKSEEFGHTIDEVENLIKKHEAFEKAAAAQEERFAALERLTTFELKDMKRRQDEDMMRQDIIEKQKEQEKARSRDVPDTRSESGSIKGEKHPDGELEGMLVRKHEWESTTKKASNRSWEKLCVVLKGSQIMFYKDQKTYRSKPEETFRSESPVDLIGGVADVAADYTKKKHVFRLKLLNGGDYLFQAVDDEQMQLWVEAINRQAQGLEETPGKSQTLPPGSDKKDEPKRRSFFTLKKK